MEPLPSEVSSPLQPLQALGVAVSASLGVCRRNGSTKNATPNITGRRQEQMLKKVLNMEQI